MLGIEGDLQFPNKISGSQTLSSDVSGQASYADTVLMFSTVRGRVGYAFDKWLVCGTGGFALSRDQLDRTQLSGSAGKAVAGDVDTLRLTSASASAIHTALQPFLPARTFREGAAFPYSRLLQAAFIRQTIDLGGKTEEVEADANRFGGSQTADRFLQLGIDQHRQF